MEARLQQLTEALQAAEARATAAEARAKIAEQDLGSTKEKLAEARVRLVMAQKEEKASVSIAPTDMSELGDGEESDNEEQSAWAALRLRAVDLFGEQKVDEVINGLHAVINEHKAECQAAGQGPGPAQMPGSRDCCLITYANTLVDGENGVTRPGGKKPLRCLGEFLTRYGVADTHRAMHLLPMFPWDTDRGFSIKDYWRVEPEYGDWSDIEWLTSAECGGPTLMFDYVCNHASVENPFVQGALIQRHVAPGHPQHQMVQQYKDFVIAYAEKSDDPALASQQPPPDDALLKLARPRANPVLTNYFVVDEGGSCRAILGTPAADYSGTGTMLGSGSVWTTFSRGKNAEGKEGTRQVDLNYRNPQLVIQVVKILLFYVRKKSSLIRLDAIGYIWKVLGSASIHERGTHMMLAFLYGALQIAAPGVVTIAEVNEPQHKCFDYLGREDHPEGDMVYNFSGMPLALHGIVKEDPTEFCRWLGTMNGVHGRQFLTALGCHDGLAQKQARELLPPQELDLLHKFLIEEQGCTANYAKLPGGKQIVYELCGTPWNIINGTKDNEPLYLQLSRYIAVLCMDLIPRGMPGIYINGLLGTKNYVPPGGLDEKRTLNREIFNINELFPKLDDPSTQEGMTLRAVQAILKSRNSLIQFDSDAPPPMVVESGDTAVAAVILEPAPPSSVTPLLVLVNCSKQPRTAKVRGLPPKLLGCRLHDKLEGAGAIYSKGVGTALAMEWQSRDPIRFDVGQPGVTVELGPYEVRWLTSTSRLNIERQATVGHFNPWTSMEVRLAYAYGHDGVRAIQEGLQDVILEHEAACRKLGISPGGGAELGPRDVCLITYANTFSDFRGKHTKKPLRCLGEFLTRYNVSNTHRAMHLLPMFPWDTDRGFSIKDFWSVEPSYGDWSDIQWLAGEECGSPQLMFDFVCNHASVENPMIQYALVCRHVKPGHPMYDMVQPYKDFVIAYCEDDGPEDNRRPSQELLSKLMRPRANPVLTPYFIIEDPATKQCRAILGSPQADAPPSASTIIGTGYCWTTFSRGKNKNGEEQTRQVDLNYRNPKIILEILRILLFYVRQSSKLIRLDAIGYIWKVIGSNSIHEPGTHNMLAILYGALQIAAPGVATIAEVNEPQHKCFDYLGDSEHPEGDQVYNFSGMPMALHAQISGNTSWFSKWLQSMDRVEGRQFLTVLGSHDGLAQKQARELLPEEELDRMHKTLIDERGCIANYATLSGGKKIVYELCGTPWSITNGVKDLGETLQLQLARYINVLCLSLLARGMPGIYINGLIGKDNYNPPGGVDEARTLNREVFDIHEVFPKLDDPRSQEGATLRAIQAVLRVRQTLPQFDRAGPPPEMVMSGDKAILAVILEPAEEDGESKRKRTKSRQLSKPKSNPDLLMARTNSMGSDSTPSRTPKAKMRRATTLVVGAQVDGRCGPLLALVNVSDQPKAAEVRGLPTSLKGCVLRDALHGAGAIIRAPDVASKASTVEVFSAQDVSDGLGDVSPSFNLTMAPYEILWLVRGA